MSKAIFNFKGEEVIIQCSMDEKMKNIYQRYSSKINIDLSKKYFIYNGNRINEEECYDQIINEEDRKRKVINILVYDNDDKTIIYENTNQSKDIICPKCKENILIKLNDYKIKLLNCKNGHNLKYILLNKYENTQKIDISKIICNECKIKNKRNVFNNEMYTCFNCNINLCPLCKSKHNKEHKIINYDEKSYICNKHNENYTKYCNECKLNICIKCEAEHKNHKTLYYGDILPKKDNDNELREYIDKLKYDIKDMIKKLENIMDNIEIYYKISYKSISNDKIRNYEIIKNKNEFINYNDIIIKDIKEIINDINIENKFKNLMNIYNKINNKNYIIAEIEIKKNDINKDIRIINSYEQYKRENKNDKEYNNKYENEKKIKENCKIKLNNEKIPFSYFHKFKREGKYQIKYSFTKNIINSVYLFSGCTSLININLSNFNIQKDTNMYRMFYGCSSLTKINLSQNITNMEGIFEGCSLLKNIDLSINKDRREAQYLKIRQFFRIINIKYIKKNLEGPSRIYRIFYLLNITRNHINISKQNFNLVIIRKWRFISFIKKIARRKLELMYKNLHPSYLEMTNELFGEDELNLSVIKEFEKFGNNIGMFTAKDNSAKNLIKKKGEN